MSAAPLVWGYEIRGKCEKKQLYHYIGLAPFTKGWAVTLYYKVIELSFMKQ